MKTEICHDDAIAGMSVYDEFHHDLGEAWDGGLPEHQAARQQPEPDIACRDDAEVRRDVLRALVLDSLVPLSVDAQVSDGLVTLTGTVGSEHERKDAIYLAGCVPGVIGVLEQLRWVTDVPAVEDRIHVEN